MKSMFNVKLLSIVFTLASVGLVSCGNNNTTTETENSSDSTDAKLHAMATLSATTDTSLTGTVMFDQDGEKVKMHLELNIPSKADKSVAVHIHAMGDCGDMGKMAGGHWNPTNEDHGKWGSGAYHSGDIGNIALDATGKGTMDLETDRWSIGGDSTTNILDRTIIVHGGEDDYTSQPSGNSGERIGCGVIKKSEMGSM